MGRKAMSFGIPLFPFLIPKYTYGSRSSRVTRLLLRIATWAISYHPMYVRTPQPTSVILPQFFVRIQPTSWEFGMKICTDPYIRGSWVKRLEVIDPDEDSFSQLNSTTESTTSTFRQSFSFPAFTIRKHESQDDIIQHLHPGRLDFEPGLPFLH